MSITKRVTIDAGYSITGCQDNNFLFDRGAVKENSQYLEINTSLMWKASGKSITFTAMRKYKQQ